MFFLFCLLIFFYAVAIHLIIDTRELVNNRKPKPGSMYGSFYNGDAKYAGTRTHSKSFTHHRDDGDGTEDGHEDFVDEISTKKHRASDSLDED